MGRSNNDIDWGGWILTVIMLGAFWPVGLVLLVRQLMGYSRKSRRVKKHPYDLQREQQAQYAQNAQNFTQGAQTFTQSGAQPYSYGTPQQQSAAQRGSTLNSQYQQTQWYAQQQAAKAQQTARAQQAQMNRGGWEAVKRSSPKERFRQERTGRTLTIVGGILVAVFGLAILSAIGDWWGYWRILLEELFPLLGFFGAGLVCLGVGRRKKKEAKRYKKYLAYIGKNQEVSISALASAMGLEVKTVYDDLQNMLDDGILPMGYVDVAQGVLVLSDEGISSSAAAPAPEAKPEPEPEQPVKKTIEDENAILQEIREVNDAIPDEVMSAKIDRIGEITGKILDYQRSHPGKSGQLRSFLNYYLPTTLKILRAYAQLDAQGIEGENITAAKKRIENMMDQVVDGFEKQLDKLFADDALDINADVQVLENMLRKDGLAGDGMTVGGAFIPEGGAFSAQQAYLDLQKVASELEGKKKDDGQITLQI